MLDLTNPEWIQGEPQASTPPPEKKEKKILRIGLQPKPKLVLPGPILD